MRETADGTVIGTTYMGRYYRSHKEGVSLDLHEILETGFQYMYL